MVAPKTLRIPISFVRRSPEKAAKPIKPKHDKPYVTSVDNWDDTLPTVDEHFKELKRF